MKITKVKKSTFKPMPPFKTMDEEANFWDTHSAFDNIDEGAMVGFHKTNKTGILTVRFEKNICSCFVRRLFRWELTHHTFENVGNGKINQKCKIFLRE